MYILSHISKNLVELGNELGLPRITVFCILFFIQTKPSQIELPMTQKTAIIFKCIMFFSLSIQSVQLSANTDSP